MRTRVANRSGYGPAALQVARSDLHVVQRQLVHPRAQLVEGRQDVGGRPVLGVEHLQDVLGLEDRLGAPGGQPVGQRLASRPG